VVSYKGVCIGGPLDGQQLAHSSRAYRCVEMPKLTLSPDEYLSEDYVTAKYHTYEWGRIGFGSKDVCFWFENTQFNSVHDAMLHLFKTYQRAALAPQKELPDGALDFAAHEVAEQCITGGDPEKFWGITPQEEKDRLIDMYMPKYRALAVKFWRVFIWAKDEK
jgi:hypothetical protein